MPKTFKLCPLPKPSPPNGQPTTQQPNNPLHGITLEQIVKNIVELYGWEELASRININCFKNDPSIKSSLKFLRKTPWAREKVEQLYLNPPTKQTSLYQWKQDKGG